MPKQNSGNKALTKKKFNLSILQLSILIGIFAFIVIYLGFSIYFKNHFLYGSEINNINVSCKTIDEANQLLHNSTEKYELTINGRKNQTAKITASDINLKYKDNNKIAEFKNAQNPLAWIVSIFSKDSNEIQDCITYDTDALKKHYDSLSIFSNENMTEPKNATIIKENGEFIIKDEDLGSKIDKDKLFLAVEEAIKTEKQTLDIEESDCYIKPEITSTSDSIVNAKNNLDKFSNVTITYNIRGNTETLAPEKIKEWLAIDDKLNINIDDKSATDYVQSLANKYDTSGGTRTFNSTERGPIEVSGGSYGWKINVKEETQQLFKLIRDGENVTREPIYSIKPSTTSGNEIGNTYIEIDLTKQYLWMYVNGNKVVESDIVSGDASGKYSSTENFETPSGTYYIYNKEPNATLRGEGYETPVAYWMPFNGGIGLHDATWRGPNDFSGEIYKTPGMGGSHGCFNHPLDVAATIFQNAYSGLPVVCYR